MSCITKIKSALESMTATEQMIGRYILEHRHEVLEMNTLELGWQHGLVLLRRWAIRAYLP